MMSTKDDNTNWLGFSLSPQLTMEASAAPEPHNHQFTHQTETHPTSASFYLSSSHLNSSTSCYSVCENGDFYSPLSTMPLKSDGSLCIMEDQSMSHSQGSSPKLEDFLGIATMATHQYGTSHHRDAMVLSLDSAFYEEESFRQHYYSALNCNGIYQTTQDNQPKENQLVGYNSQIPAPISEVEFPCLKTWIDQQVNNSSMVEDRSVMGCGELQSLSLSMSPGSQSSCITASRKISPTIDCVATETKKRGSEKIAQKQTVHRKSIDTFGLRTSQYRGVTRHRWTGRYEAHLWDNSCKKEGQTRKGRQVYLGGYDMEEKAARAYDLAALKYWGPSTHVNFALENYQQEIQAMKNMSRQEYVAHLRRKSSGFSRGASIYRGVTRHHQHGRWQARIGRVAGNKDLYLGTFSTQEEAGEAYDVAAIKFRGVNAVTNFDISRYDVEKIMASTTLPTGEIARRNKEPVKEVGIDITAQKNEVCAQENYQNPCFSVALHDLINISSSQTVMDDESSTPVPQHFSNPSSLITSLSSSREASPDQNGASILFSKMNPTETRSNLNSWIPAANLRPVSLAAMAHLPLFASWNDV